jgi:hypothetical protein
MITGEQPKVLLSQVMIGTLVRERDGLTRSGRIGFIEWMPDGTYKEFHLEPQVGFGIIVDPHRMNYTWLTTTITSIKRPTENTYEFETENSKYTLTYTIQMGI